MNKNKKIILILCSFFIVLSGILYVNSDSIGRYMSEKDNLKSGLISSVQSYGDSENVSSGDTNSDSATDTSKRKGKIVVYICGAVKKPGVYEFETDSRVYDAIKAANGFKKDAVRTAINQARPLEDGEQINIPTVKQLKKKSSSLNSQIEKRQQSEADSSSENSGLVNINTASASELTSLSGIGQSRADAIIEYRETNGGFKDISDIMKISGIKEGIFNKIKNKISV